MADIATTPAPKRRNWIRIFGIVFLVLVLGLVGLYFVFTSAGFIKSAILPRVSKSMGAEITVSDLSLSPFKQIILKDLKVQAPGREPLFTSPEVRVDYRLMDILRGNYNLDLVSIKSPVISLVERADKTSNLDPIMEELAKNKNDDPMNLDLKKLVVSNGTIRYEQAASSDGSLNAEMSNIEVNIDGLKTGGVGKLTLNGNVQMHSTAPAPGTNGSLAGTVTGTLDLGLTPMLMPTVIKGTFRKEITKADGAYAMAAGMAFVFDADVAPGDVKQLALRLQQGQKTLGEFSASGPFNLEKVEGTLDVRVSNIDKQALNLFTAGTGMDFGGTAINSTNRIQVTNGGQSFTAAGGLLVSNFQVTRTNQTTPSMNLQAGYDVSVDQVSSNIVLRALTLSGSQSGKEFMKGSLSAPMVVNWGKTNDAVGDSAFSLVVSDFNLGDWKAFMGETTASGTVNSKIGVISKSAGKLIGFTHQSAIENLSVAMGSNQVSQLAIKLSGDGEARDMVHFTTKYDLEVSHAKTRALQVSGTGTYEGSTEEARADVKGTADIPALLRMVPMPDTAFSAGAAQFNLVLQQKGEQQQVQGDFNMQNLTGMMGSNSFQNFALAAKLDAVMNPRTAELRKTTLTLSQAGKAGGLIEMSGTYGLSNQVAQFQTSVKDLNQNVLRTFLQSALGDKVLTSLAVNGKASGNYDPTKPSSITADFAMSNLVVKDPAGEFPEKPLEASLAFEASIDKNVADIRKGVLSLTPTARATNQIQLAGRIDMTDTNFTSGNLKVTSESLDVTTYYDLFGGKEETSATLAAGAKPSQAGTRSAGPASPAPEQEAEPMILPMTNFVAEVNVGRFYLGELEITNIVVTTKLDGGRVRVNPFQMAMNGAPVKSTIDLDMSVPGYRYDVAFEMGQVPLAPLVNTFAPERKGQLGGTLTANAQVKGLGTTGAGMQKNLSGSFRIGTTNLNLSVSEMASPLLKTIINSIAVVPSIIKNPTSGLTSLAGTLFGGASGTNKVTGAWGDELMKSPIDVIEANGTMGAGTIKLDRAFVQSLAFQAEARGTVELAKVLTNSTLNIPLNVTIRRSLAESVNLVPPGTATNAAYVKLPDYVTVKGTVGEPKADINKMALAGTALQQYGGNIPGVDQKTGNIIQGLGSIITGRQSGTTNVATGTNATPTQTNRIGGLLQGLGGLLGTPQQSTNSPSAVTNQSTQTQTNSVGSLIEGLFGRPKKK